MHRKR